MYNLFMYYYIYYVLLYIHEYCVSSLSFLILRDIFLKRMALRPKKGMRALKENNLIISIEKNYKL